MNYLGQKVSKPFYSLYIHDILQTKDERLIGSMKVKEKL